MSDGDDEHGNWAEAAGDVYREAFAELVDKWLGRPLITDIEFFVEELKEALLDLKFSVLNGEPSAAATHADEVMLLLFELRLRSRDV